jgi:hypothetical protein
MTAQSYLNDKFPMQHTFPKSQVIQMMEDFWSKKKDLYEKAKKEFNSESWQAQHNLEEMRKRFKNKK